MSTIDGHKYQLNQINLYGGDVKLFTTKKSNGIWYVKIYIHEESKYFQKSLRTRDEDYARRLAEDEYIKIKAKRLNGQQIFSITLHKVIDQWLDEEYKTVGISKTEGRHKTLITQANWLRKFISDKNVKIETISTHHFMHYYKWRRQQRAAVQNVTLINEASTIRSIFKYAIRKGYISSVFFLEFPKIEKNVGRREALSIEEWRKIYTFLRSKKFLNDGDTTKSRYFIRDFAVLLANTGLRFGEARRLRWKHVKVVRGKTSEKKLCEIKLDADMTKNKKSRVVQGMRGDVLERIKTYSNYKHSNDFIFVDNKSGNQLERTQYYRSWKFMLKNTGLDQSDKDISYYNLRHSYATWRLYAGVDSRSLCENLGCGLQFLEQHYGHLQTKMMRDKLTKGIDSDIKYLLEE